MVLSARSAALFSSRTPSILTSVSSARPWRAALHTRAPAPGLPGRAPFNTSKFGPLISQRLLTTQREKVKVLAVLYDGGEHAQQVRTNPQSFAPHCLPLACPLLAKGWYRASCVALGMRGTVEHPCVTLVMQQDCRGVSEPSGKWGKASAVSPVLAEPSARHGGVVEHPRSYPEQMG
jgi:hypothetical protein